MFFCCHYATHVRISTVFCASRLSDEKLLQFISAFSSFYDRYWKKATCTIAGKLACKTTQQLLMECFKKELMPVQ